jgi:hypothetical protein
MQIQAFFKKNALFTEPEVTRAAAKANFDLAERRCRITNRRLDYYFLHRDRLDPDVKIWLSRMEKEIYDIVGPLPTFWDFIPEGGRVTSGATASMARRSSQPFRKLSGTVCCTPNAVRYLKVAAEFFGVFNPKFRLRSANRVEFVPKNWKTDRTIACEPEGNMYLQLAVDGFLKRQLRKVGVDLSNQFPNQELARVGSVDGSFATVDLSMASDTLAFNTVAWLLPWPWFQMLNDFRCPSWRRITKEHDSVEKPVSEDISYSKFSSMGNGCTFTLETLIFVAAVRAVGARKYRVYGDDIVIPTKYYTSLLKLLRFIGFRINQDKSFHDGPFRESCGANWYQGVDITPVYIREVDRRRATICHLVNSLVAIAEPWGELWEYLRGLVNETFLLPLVPYNENTMSGVWIDPHTAYGMKLIKIDRRNHRWEPMFKGFVAKSTGHRNRGVRASFLWHLRASQGRRSISPMIHGIDDFIDGSGYTTPSHKYVRKWVHWNLPVAGTPAHLYWWADYLVRVS